MERQPRGDGNQNKGAGCLSIFVIALLSVLSVVGCWLSDCPGSGHNKSWNIEGDFPEVLEKKGTVKELILRGSGGISDL